MKSLSEFKPVMDALAKIASESSLSHDNGTAGKEYLCHYWGYEEMYDKNKAAKEKEVVDSLIKGDLVRVVSLRKELEMMPKVKVVMTFKLIAPIRRLPGTKILYADGKTYSPSMENVEYINIPQDAIDLKLCAFDEIGQKALDKHGEETEVIKLVLKSCMLDVKEAQYGLDGKMIRGARANVTAISYRSMQVAGSVLGREESKRRNVYGMEEV